MIAKYVSIVIKIQLHDVTVKCQKKDSRSELARWFRGLSAGAASIERSEFESAPNTFPELFPFVELIDRKVNCKIDVKKTKFILQHLLPPCYQFATRDNLFRAFVFQRK